MTKIEDIRVRNTIITEEYDTLDALNYVLKQLETWQLQNKYERDTLFNIMMRTRELITKKNNKYLVIIEDVTEDQEPETTVDLLRDLNSDLGMIGLKATNSFKFE